MTADFDLNLTVQGTPEELLSIINLMKRYSDGEKGIYFSFSSIESGDRNEDIDYIDPDELQELISDCDGSITITASGPYGSYGMLSDIEFFEDMSAAAPGASFNGVISGGTSYTDESMTAELKDGILNLISSCVSNDAIPDAFYEYFTGILPYEKFVEIFKVNTEQFEEEDYQDFITCELSSDEAFSEMEYDEFIELLGIDCDIKEDEFNEIINQFDIMDFDSFYDSISDLDEFGDVTKLRYDPVAKQYLDGNQPLMKSNVVYNANDDIRQYLMDNGLPHDDEYINALSIDDVYSIMAGTYGKDDISAKEEKTVSAPDEPAAEEEAVTVTNEPAAEEETVPITDEPAAKDEAVPVTDESAAEEEAVPVTDEPAAEEETVPVTDEPAAEEEAVPVTDEPAAEEEAVPVTDEPAAKGEAVSAPDESVESEAEGTEVSAPAPLTKKKFGWLVWLIVLLLVGGATAAYLCCDVVSSAVNSFIEYIMQLIQ